MRKLVAIIALPAFAALLLLLLFACPSTATAAQARPEQPDMTIDAATRTQVIEAALKRLNEQYVFPETAQKMEQAIRQRVDRKEYDNVTSAKEFAKLLTTHLQEISRDKHLHVDYFSEVLPPAAPDHDEPTAEEREKYRQLNRRVNFGFDKVERLPATSFSVQNSSVRLPLRQ